jgi:hypothetical protein
MTDVNEGVKYHPGMAAAILHQVFVPTSILASTRSNAKLPPIVALPAVIDTARTSIARTFALVGLGSQWYR